MIRRAAMNYWDTRQLAQPQDQAGHQVVAADVKYPLADPGWNINNEAHRTNMKDLRDMILEGIKRAVPQSTNLTKAFEVNQQKEESPGDFIQRIRDHLTKYSGVAPDSAAFDNLLKMQFVTKAWPDI